MDRKKIILMIIMVLLLLLTFMVGVITGIESTIAIGKWTVEQLNITPINDTCICVGLK